MSSVQEMIGRLKPVLPEGAVTADEDYRCGAAFTVQAPIEKLRDVVRMFDEGEFYLETMTALDFEDTFELVYHFNRYEPKSRIVLRVLCGQGQTPDTVSDIFAGAAWLEREVHEFFGISFQGNADMRNLLLPEDADYHPLRKNFGTVQAYRKREEIYG
ncbi:MAG: NADH-quinone oxidoreductase subunit C [Syntrophobacteraceae bacterium]|nr:NADH-quinone oxidoreductase subunit C [Desulfobacteraceae bacterium]